MSWMNNIILLVITNAIAGTVAYACWWIFARILKRSGRYKTGRRLFCCMLFFWLAPVNFILMELSYYKKDGAWYGLPYHADMYLPLLNALACLWLAGVFISACHVLIALYHLNSLPLSRRRDSVSAAGRLAKAMAFDAWAKDDNGSIQLYPGLNWSEEIFVYCAPVPVPAACPGLHPKIYLPPRHYDREELQMIVAHEVNHILSGDLKIRCCLLVLKVIFWFHPLAWRMFDDFEYWSEISCDIDVCYGGRIAVEPKKYLELLLRTSKSPGPIYADKIYARKYFMSDLSPDAKRLKQRFREILGYKKRRLGKAVTALLTVLFLLVGAVATLAAGIFAEQAVAGGIGRMYVSEEKLSMEKTPFTVTNYVKDGRIQPWSLDNYPENENTFYRYYDHKTYGSGDVIFWFLGNVGDKAVGSVQSFYFKAGQTVTLYTDISLRQSGLRAGFIFPDGFLHYLCLEEMVYGSFEIEKSGSYELYVENTGDLPAVIGGSILYTPEK